MPWNQMLTAYALLVGMTSSIGYLVARLVASPVSEKAAAKTKKELQEWSSKEFASLTEFEVHCKVTLEREKIFRRDLDRLQKQIDDALG